MTASARGRGRGNRPRVLDRWETMTMLGFYSDDLSDFDPPDPSPGIQPRGPISRDENLALGRKLVDNWNSAHGDGVIVDVELDDGSVVRTVTRSGADMLGDSTPVVWLKHLPGRRLGCYRLDRVTIAPRPTEADEEALEYDRAGGMAECPSCGKVLRDHPDDLDHPGYDGRPFLVKLCDGRRVKL